MRPNVQRLIDGFSRKDRGDLDDRKDQFEQLCQVVPAEQPIIAVATFATTEGPWANMAGVIGLTFGQVVIVSPRGNHTIPVADIEWIRERARYRGVQAEVGLYGQQHLWLFGRDDAGSHFYSLFADTHAQSRR
jgi:hypothetical protein